MQYGTTFEPSCSVASISKLRMQYGTLTVAPSVLVIISKLRMQYGTMHSNPISKLNQHFTKHVTMIPKTNINYVSGCLLAKYLT